MGSGRFALAGDHEATLESGDMIYMDGVSFPLYGELFGPKVHAVLLEDINFIAEVVQPSE